MEEDFLSEKTYSEKGSEIDDAEKKDGISQKSKINKEVKTIMVVINE